MATEREAPRRSARLQTPANSSAETDNETVVPDTEDSTSQLSELEYTLSPEHQNSEVDGEELLRDSTPPQAIPYAMSDTAVTSALNKASEISKLNGPDDWIEWNRKLRGHLGMVDLWATLTGDVPEPTTGTPEHTLWKSHQRKLASLLLLISGPSALSLIELTSDESATVQYLFLKSTYNTATITTFSTAYRRIHRCSITNHKSLKEYGEEVTSARNRLKELKRPVDELQVTCAFLDGLDSSYQAWKDMFLGSHVKNPTSTVQGVVTMLVPTIEEVLKQLTDRESRIPSLSQKSASRALGANDRSKEKDKDSKDSEDPSKSRPLAQGIKSSKFQRPSRYCETCYSTNHFASNCWYTHTDKASEKFKSSHPNADSLKKALEEINKAKKEWEKSHPQKGPIAAKIFTTGNKYRAWYHNHKPCVQANNKNKSTVLFPSYEQVEVVGLITLQSRTSTHKGGNNKGVHIQGEHTQSSGAYAGKLNSVNEDDSKHRPSAQRGVLVLA